MILLFYSTLLTFLSMYKLPFVTFVLINEDDDDDDDKMSAVLADLAEFNH